jgi:hypothetical protein
MNDVNFGDLVGRMAISLIVVLALVFIAYRVIKRRQDPFSAATPRSTSGGRAPRRPRSGRMMATGSARAGSAKRGLRTVGRVALSRSSAVVAVQFADRVLLIGASEQGLPTVLAELDLPSWTAATEVSEELLPIGRMSPDVGQRRPTMLDALREATARRG